MISYRDAGVDVAKGDEAVKRLKKHVDSTHNEQVLKAVGAFAGALHASKLKSMDDPVLLATMDGVGTKTLIAAALGKWNGVGHDIVNHCGNDLVCQGAKPLFFLDYIASGALQPDIVEYIVRGMSEACRALQCPILGGELAEMPQVYADGAYDVVGTMVGIVDRAKMITGELIEAGDLLIALPSNGLHTNGYSLARKVLTNAEEHIDELGCSVGEALLKPHTSYANTVLSLHREIGLKGVAHITGGGIPGNLPRILPEGLGANVERECIHTPSIFTLIQKRGGISEDEMSRTFNLGVGMVLVVEKDKANAVLKNADGSCLLGEIVPEQGVRIL